MLRIATEGKGIILLFSVFWSFFYDVMIFDFKFGSNRTAGSEDTTRFVAAHGPYSPSGFRSYPTSVSHTLEDSVRVIDLFILPHTGLDMTAAGFLSST